MKQRISPEQLAELTPEQQERLREWWKPAQGDLFIWTESPEDIETLHKYDGWAGEYLAYNSEPPCNWKEEDKANALPLLSIGQMIELLQDKIAYFDMTNIFAGTGGKLCWGIMKPKHFDIRADELCDALFVAIKKIL